MSVSTYELCHRGHQNNTKSIQYITSSENSELRYITQNIIVHLYMYISEFHGLR